MSRIVVPEDWSGQPEPADDRPRYKKLTGENAAAANRLRVIVATLLILIESLTAARFTPLMILGITAAWYVIAVTGSVLWLVVTGRRSAQQGGDL